jgi:hypothetical protein
MDIEPGPFTEREPLPLGPRISREGLFEQLAAQLVDPLSGADGGLDRLRATVGDGVPTDLDATYAATVGAADDAHASFAGSLDDRQGDTLADRGGAVDARRASVARYLPDADADVDASFVDVPDSSVIHTGRGFDTITGPPETPPGRAPGPGPGPIEEASVRRSIRRFYLDLLGREPDAAGWDFYTDQVLNHGWSLDDVRNAILQSDEYLAKHPS